jgi:hypothetical protein
VYCYVARIRARSPGNYRVRIHTGNAYPPTRLEHDTLIVVP